VRLPPPGSVRKTVAASQATRSEVALSMKSMVSFSSRLDVKRFPTWRRRSTMTLSSIPAGVYGMVLLFLPNTVTAPLPVRQGLVRASQPRRRGGASRPGTRSLAGLEGLDQLGQDLQAVADDAEVGQL